MFEFSFLAASESPLLFSQLYLTSFLLEAAAEARLLFRWRPSHPIIIIILIKVANGLDAGSCCSSKLLLNTRKTKEAIGDLRKSRPEHSGPSIDDVEMVPPELD